MKDKKIVYILGILAFIFGILLFYSFYRNTVSEKQRVAKELELDSVYNQLDSISIELGNKIITISQLGGEIDTLLAIKEKIENEKKEFRKKTYSQINRLQSKVNGYKELLYASIRQIFKWNQSLILTWLISNVIIKCY